MEQKFKIGDVVRLKSGGPDMTVAGYKTRNIGAVLNVIKKHGGMKPDLPEHETQVVVCTWFDETKQKNNDFDEELLELVAVK